jgi:hypothetical protein
MPTQTYVPLATFTGSGTTHSFTNISQAYDHLLIVNYSRLSSAGPNNLYINVGNGSYDSGNNYTFKWYGANNTGGFNTGQNTTVNGMYVGAVDSSYYNISTSIIMNYRSTSIQKNYMARNGGYNSSNQSNGIWGGQWVTSNTAINQLQLTTGAASMDAGSTTTIYGLVAQ